MALAEGQAYTMGDYLVVIGSVDDAQCEPARREMREKGLRPLVVRIEDTYFLLNVSERGDRYRECRTLICVKMDGELVEPIEIPVASVCGLVIPESVWLDPYHVRDCYPDDFTGLAVSYVVRTDGRVDRV